MDGDVIILSTSKVRVVLVLLMSAAAAAIGVAMVRHGEPLIGSIGAIFFGLAFLGWSFMLIPGVSDLKIDRSGIRRRDLFRPLNLSWNDVNRFYVTHIAAGYSSVKVIAIEYSDTYQKHRIGRGLSTALSGVQDGLPNTFNRPAEEVCEVLNQAKAKWGSANA